jgi:hypothetical protein
MSRLPRSLLTLLLALPLGCSDPEGPSPIVDPPDPPDPPAAPGVAPAVFPGSVSDPSGSAASAWLSLPAGAMPTATGFRVHNRATGVTRQLSGSAGGFDPIAVAATAGDTVEVTIQHPDTAITTLARVPMRKRPRVVRTSPAAGRVDVALNSVVTIVFSEPIDPATATAARIRLLAGTDPVPGLVRPVAGSEVGFEFVPSAPLAPGTTYTLELTADVADASGDLVEGDRAFAFTTVMTGGEPPAEAPPTDPTDPTAPALQIDPIAPVAVGEMFTLRADIDLSRIPDGGFYVSSAGLWGPAMGWTATARLEIPRLWLEYPGVHAVCIWHWYEIAMACTDVTVRASTLPPGTLAVESFSMLEIRNGAERIYLPLLRLAETGGRGPATPFRIQFSIAGVTMPDYCSREHTLAPGVAEDVNPRLGDTHRIAFRTSAIGPGVVGEQAIVYVLYRDAEGRNHGANMTTTIVAGVWPPDEPFRWVPEWSEC